MDLIAKELNFEYEMHEADDEMFGIMRDNVSETIVISSFSSIRILLG